MFLICQNDCHGPSTVNQPWMLFHRGEGYEIDLDSPVVIHFTTPPGASPEDVQTLRQAQRTEAARSRAEKENKRAAAPAEDSEEDFTSFKLADGK